MLKRLVWLLLLLVGAAGVAAAVVQSRLSMPFRGFSEPEVFVDLPTGTSVSGIAARLEEAGVVRDAMTFRIAARLSGEERRLQAGEYRFAVSATPYEIVSRLARGDVFTRPVTVPEGLTIFEVAAIAERAGLGTAAEFIASARSASLIGEFDPEARTLEGYLFPDTYPLSRKAGVDGLVQAMVTRFGTAYDVNLRAAATAAGLDTREVVTLASIIEKETGRAEERPLVAAVYRNRLRIGMPLQCDPTVIYALMLKNRWNGNLTRADLEMESPYNTYRVTGLPPGPIASPGRDSLDAAVHPAPVDYLYFVSRNDGSHAFAATLAEHNRNVAMFQLHRGRD